eukprot:TRINITY_DN5244_c0_g1_i3.p1 TRINITY_DN5244_c0_g1~~TRINITY_DN5244_c0_g1_i3.p1  ORF type:complete len:1338 (-),score=346.46 TRINITY_DN5244_c0_g1_i3:354-4367(-)
MHFLLQGLKSSCGLFAHKPAHHCASQFFVIYELPKLKNYNWIPVAKEDHARADKLAAANVWHAKNTPDRISLVQSPPPATPVTSAAQPPAFTPAVPKQCVTSSLDSLLSEIETLGLLDPSTATTTAPTQPEAPKQAEDVQPRDSGGYAVKDLEGYLTMLGDIGDDSANNTAAPTTDVPSGAGASSFLPVALSSEDDTSRSLTDILNDFLRPDTEKSPTTTPPPADVPDVLPSLRQSQSQAQEELDLLFKQLEGSTPAPAPAPALSAPVLTLEPVTAGGDVPVATLQARPQPPQMKAPQPGNLTPSPAVAASAPPPAAVSTPPMQALAPAEAAETELAPTSETLSEVEALLMALQNSDSTQPAQPAQPPLYTAQAALPPPAQPLNSTDYQIDQLLSSIVQQQPTQSKTQTKPEQPAPAAPAPAPAPPAENAIEDQIDQLLSSIEMPAPVAPAPASSLKPAQPLTSSADQQIDELLTTIVKEQTKPQAALQSTPPQTQLDAKVVSKLSQEKPGPTVAVVGGKEVDIDSALEDLMSSIMQESASISSTPAAAQTCTASPVSVVSAVAPKIKPTVAPVAPRVSPALEAAVAPVAAPATVLPEVEKTPAPRAEVEQAARLQSKAATKPDAALKGEPQCEPQTKQENKAELKRETQLQPEPEVEPKSKLEDENLKPKAELAPQVRRPPTLPPRNAAAPVLKPMQPAKQPTPSVEVPTPEPAPNLLEEKLEPVAGNDVKSFLQWPPAEEEVPAAAELTTVLARRLAKQQEQEQQEQERNRQLQREQEQEQERKCQQEQEQERKRQQEQEQERKRQQEHEQERKRQQEQEQERKRQQEQEQERKRQQEHEQERKRQQEQEQERKRQQEQEQERKRQQEQEQQRKRQQEQERKHQQEKEQELKRKQEQEQEQERQLLLQQELEQQEQKRKQEQEQEQELERQRQQQREQEYEQQRQAQLHALAKPKSPIILDELMSPRTAAARAARAPSPLFGGRAVVPVPATAPGAVRPKQATPAVKRICAADLKFGDKIGEGALGETFHAVLLSPGAAAVAVAAKRLRCTPASAGARQRVASELAAEVERLRRVLHDCAVAACGVCLDAADGPCIVTPFIDGSDLRVFARGERGATASAEDKVRIVKALAAVFTYFHSIHVIHGSFKATDVIIDAEMKPHVRDFGFMKQKQAAFRERRQCQRGATQQQLDLLRLQDENTPPEASQTGVLPLDKRGDVFAWGLVVWELFEGALKKPDIKRGEEMRFTSTPDLIAQVILKCTNANPQEGLVLPPVSGFIAGRCGPSCCSLLAPQARPCAARLAGPPTAAPRPRLTPAARRRSPARPAPGKPSRSRR